MLAPYLWASGLTGTVGVKGRSVDVDQSFGDILSNLDMGFMGVSEIRNNRFGIFSDLVYAKLSETKNTPHGILADRIGATSKNLMWTAAAEYRIVNATRTSLDVLGGFRLFSVGNELHFKGGPLDGLNSSQTETWADPIIGIKGNIDLTRRLYLTGWAMIGGFGVSSDSVWDVMGGFGYDFNRSISSVLGYRAAGVDYKNGGYSYDVTQEGPFAGVVFRF